MVGAYAVTAGGLALRRHANLQSQALDMGYADQVTWNALHGHGLRFTVFRGLVGAENGRPLQFGPGGDRDSLFAYHVELLYFPISLLYLVHAGPETLIVLLTAGLALGALPAYWIAHHRLRHRGAALAFAAMFLLFPSLQAANLSDFHAVSLSATLLLLTFFFLLTGRQRAFVALAAVCVAAKEDVGLVVAMMGLYAWLVRGERRLGLAVAGGSLAWVALCFGALIPRANGGAPSLFVLRYADAFHRLREFPAALRAGHLALPLPDYTFIYVAHLLAGAGFLSILAPLELAVAAPVLAINGLSGSVWQHGGGAHYSSEAVAPLLVAAIAGTERLSALARRRLNVAPGHAAAAIALAGLAAAGLESWQQGLLPPARHFTWPAPSAHAAHLPPLLARIPPDAAVSAQSNVYPHLSGRAKVYVFPYVEDAGYVLADVAGASDPLSPDQLFPEVSALLASPRFELLAADDGFLLFHRLPTGAGGGGSLSAEPPPAFLRFTRAGDGIAEQPKTPVEGSFAGLFDLVSYRLEPLPEVNFRQRRAIPVVTFRARQRIERDYRLTTFVTGRDHLTRIYDDGNATQLWYPTHAWQPGELIRVTYPPLTYGPGDRIGVGAQIGEDADAPRLPATSSTRPILDGGRVVDLGPLP